VKIIGDCNICGEHKEVYEILREENGKQRIVLICDDCINWMEELVNECKKEYTEKHCHECANYNIGDGIDDINKCCDCEFYIM
jgi:hypothetical protein